MSGWEDCRSSLSTAAFPNHFDLIFFLTWWLVTLAQSDSSFMRCGLCPLVILGLSNLLGRASTSLPKPSTLAASFLPAR